MDTDEIDAMNDMEYDEERQGVPQKESSSAKSRGQSVQPRMDNNMDSDKYRQDVPDRSQRKAGTETLTGLLVIDKLRGFLATDNLTEFLVTEA
eukprot:8120556-Ditylum_brightwellii.AAC.1